MILLRPTFDHTQYATEGNLSHTKNVKKSDIYPTTIDIRQCVAYVVTMVIQAVEPCCH